MHKLIFNSESWKIWEKHFIKLNKTNETILPVLKTTIEKINFSSNLWEQISQQIINDEDEKYQILASNFKSTVSKWLDEANDEKQLTFSIEKGIFFKNILFEIYPILNEVFPIYFNQATIEASISSYDFIKTCFGVPQSKEFQYLELSMWLIVIIEENKLQEDDNFSIFWKKFSNDQLFKLALEKKL